MDEELKCPQCGAERSGPDSPCPACSWIPEGYELDPEKKEWFYIVKNRYKGPFTAPKMRELIRDTTVVKDTLVFQEGKQLATTAEKSPFRDEFLVEITPPPLKLLSDRWCECLMAVPPFLCILLSGFLKPGLYFWAAVAVIYFGLNALFLTKDVKECRNRGFDFFEQWMYAGIVAPPIYLLPRAQNTNHRFAYSIAWLVFAVIFFLR